MQTSLLPPLAPIPQDSAPSLMHFLYATVRPTYLKFQTVILPTIFSQSWYHCLLQSISLLHGVCRKIDRHDSTYTYREITCVYLTFSYKIGRGVIFKLVYCTLYLQQLSNRNYSYLYDYIISVFCIRRWPPSCAPTIKTTS